MTTTSSLLRELKQIRKAIATTRTVAADTSDIPDTWADFAALTSIQSGGRIVPFRPYDFQKNVVQTLSTHQNVCIAKSRQMGLSETICSWLLYRAVKEPGFSAVVFSKTQADSSNLARRIRLMALSLGRRCPSLGTDSAVHLSFEGRGSIYFLPASPRAARGIPSVSVLLLDECAFLDGADEIYMAAAPTLAMLGDRGRIIFNSTPNGLTGLFARTWFGESDTWHKLRLHYNLHPVYGLDPGWAERERQRRNYTDRQWSQEFEIDFLASDTTIFKPDDIQNAMCGGWEPGYYDRTYAFGIDPAGPGRDAYVAIVVDITTRPYKVVAMHRSTGRTTEYNLGKTLELMEEYNPTFVAVEKNGLGAPILEAIQSLRPSIRIEAVTTTSQSKITNTDRLVLLLERGELLLPQEDIFRSEFLGFKQDESGKRAADTGCTDDIVMALAHLFALHKEPEIRDVASNWYSLL